MREPIGYQDQWASALGGINLIRFAGGDVEVESIGLTAAQIAQLERNLHLVSVGAPRSASDLLARQQSRVSAGTKAESITRHLVGLVDQGRQALLTSLDDLGPLLNEAWQLKREVSQGVTNPEVDAIYESGMASGATGGKLLGAGGSGYLAFYVPNGASERFTTVFPERLAFTLSKQGAGIIHES